MKINFLKLHNYHQLNRFFLTRNSLQLHQKRYLNTTMTTTSTTSTTTIPHEETRENETLAKLKGRDLFEKLNRPTKIVAPMVDGSELAWRVISRKYGAELCYTPMMHSRLFATEHKYRDQFFGPSDGKPEFDRPLIVQFCANDPEILLQATKHVVGKCDAVDINFGCPQGIARKGHYGSFLMEEWDLVYSLINKLHTELEIPVTAKIRVFDDWSKSLEYAKMCLDAGAQFLTIHGRTRDMKGQKTGMANWKLVKYLRDNLPEGTVFISNGNILYPDDVDRCINEIGCDAVMSAEGNLCNPGVFWTKTDDKEKQFPRIDKFVREYFEIAKICQGGESKRCFKTHLFKCLKNFLPVHTDIRTSLAKLHKNSTWNEIDDQVIKPIEKTVDEIFKKDDIDQLDMIKIGGVEEWGGRYREVPYWRLQPHFRKVDGVEGKDVIKESLRKINENNKEQEEIGSKRKVIHLDSEDNKTDIKRQSN